MRMTLKDIAWGVAIQAVNGVYPAAPDLSDAIEEALRKVRVTALEDAVRVAGSYCPECNNDINGGVSSTAHKIANDIEKLKEEV